MGLDIVREDFPHQGSFGSLQEELSPRIREFGHGINLLLLQWVATTFAQFTANQNDFDIGEAHLGLFSSDASRDLTGLTPGIEGRMFPFVNTGSFDIVLKHQDANSVAANRIINRTGADVTFAGGATGLLWYDLGSSRWRQFI